MCPVDRSHRLSKLLFAVHPPAQFLSSVLANNSDLIFTTVDVRHLFSPERSRMVSDFPEEPYNSSRTGSPACTAEFRNPAHEDRIGQVQCTGSALQGPDTIEQYLVYARSESGTSGSGSNGTREYGSGANRTLSSYMTVTKPHSTFHASRSTRAFARGAA